VTLLCDIKMSSRNGRGRGISNVPAWMSQNKGGDEEMRGNNGNGNGNGGNNNSDRDRRPTTEESPSNIDYYEDKRRNYDRERGRNNEEYYSRGAGAGAGGGREGGGREVGGGGGGGGSRGGRPDNRGGNDTRGGGGDPRSGGGDPRSGGWDLRDDRRSRGRSNRHPSRERDPRSSREREPPRNRRSSGNRSGISFGSLAEEREWVEDRRRKRRERKCLFDVKPTEEQLAMEELQKATLAASGAHPASFVRLEEQPPRERTAGRTAARSQGMSSSQPQQTRHARRLYIGHLPPDLDEDEVHQFFRNAIHVAMGDAATSNTDDPILSVYINKERRFAFVEFKTMEICTACLALDGVDVCKKGKVKIKRPNDYNPSLAPATTPSQDSIIQKFDISRLGIVSSTVPDSPNKIFIGGLPYHLTGSQVMELLGAFGKVKAFHLVKADPTAATSKGYCFVEYSDGESVRDVAVMGLNGMDMGGGKVLSARIAAVRGEPDSTRDSQGSVGMSIPGLGNVAPIVPSSTTVGGVIPPQMRYVDGVDVEALLNVAMGMAPLSSAAVVASPVVPGMYYGPVSTVAIAGSPAVPQSSAAMAPVATKPVLDIANAALEAAFGSAAHSNHAPTPPSNGNLQKSRILVLLNMVADADLETDEDYNGLTDEVMEECLKFGNLLSMKIPRAQDGYPSSALKKIFLEYSTVQESSNAEKELAGRQFGPAKVVVTYFDEKDYADGKLS